MHPRRIAAPVLAALALAAAGCGDDDDGTAGTTTTTTAAEDERAERDVDEAVLERIADAVEQTVGEGTARFTVTVETEGTGSDADGEQPIEVEGEVDFEAEQRLITLEGSEGELDVVVDGDVAYLELPATEGDDWMRIELDALFDEDVGVGGPAAIPFQDPEDNLRVLEGSAVHASEEGEETIDGEDTTRYNLVIDLQEAAEEATDDVQDAVDRTAEQTSLDELEMDVWVDDDDLIRRVAYTLDLDQARVQESDDEGTVEADPEGTVTVTFDYRDFGTTVDIEIPADEDIIDLDEDAVRDAVSGDGDSSRRTTSTTGTGDDDEDDDGTTTTSSTTTTTTGS